MRAMLLGLVLLNALYWAWGRWIDAPPAVPVGVETNADLPSLRLVAEAGGSGDLGAAGKELNLDDVEPLIEIDPGSAEGTAATTSPTMAAADSPGSGQAGQDLFSQGPSAQDPSESRSTAAAESDPGEADSGEADSGAIGTDTARLSPDSGVATAGQPLPDADTPVQNASSANSTSIEPLLASNVITSSDPIANPSRCESVGPFLSLRQARAAVTLLNAAGVATQQRVEEAEVWVGHWVHLPAYPTRDAAVAVVERLRREGVKDIYIETAGDLKNSISLGLFSDIEGAEIRAGKVRKLGVRPQIVDRRRDGLVYWVDSELSTGSSIDISVFDVLPHQTLSATPITCTGRLGVIR